VLGLGADGLRHLRRGHPAGLFFWYASGVRGLGNDGGTVAAACFYRNLEGCGLDLGNNSASFEKIFGNYKNFVCICEKMGYNKK